MKFAKPTKFTIKVSHCGSNTCNGTYGLLEHEDALVLANTVVNTMAHDFVGAEHHFQFQYDLACLLLARLEGYTDEQLLQDLKDHKKLLGRWKFQPKEQPVKGGAKE